MNVPNPDDQEVLQFAAPTTLAAAADDENAGAWASPCDCNLEDTIDSNWSSRWNGGEDRPFRGIPKANGSRAESR
jgi:hypothetical protein